MRSTTRRVTGAVGYIDQQTASIDHSAAKLDADFDFRPQTAQG
jgi:hypothetical protein